MDTQPTNLGSTRIITISGRIASGSTTLAHSLENIIHWRHIEGGEIFWEAVRRKHHLAEKDTNLRPDAEDEDFDASLKKVLTEGQSLIVETKLAGFNAEGIAGVFKILVICEDGEGNDKTDIRIDRLVNREKITLDEAKEEVLVREKNDIEKWQRLYAKNSPDWVYWDKKYYDLVINTYNHNQEETLQLALKAIGYENT